MNEFLKQCSINSQSILVVGNQTADLDSCISVLLFSYLNYKTHLFPGHFVPIIQISRKDLPLRPDVLYVLNQNGIDISLIYFLDDLKNSPSPNQVFLLDHNFPTLNYFQSLNLCGIIDHHVDENYKNVSSKNASSDSSQLFIRLIQPCGSCTSLVLSLFDFSFDSNLSHLAMAPILIDTNNLKTFNQGGRATKIDLIQSQKCLPFIQSPTKYFHDISIANMNGILNMSNRDLLRRDYKQVTIHTSNHLIHLGTSAMATLKTSYKWWKKNRSGIQKSSEEFLLEKDIHILAVMFGYEEVETEIQSEIQSKESKESKEFTLNTMDNDDSQSNITYHRDLYIYSKDTLLLHTLVQKLESTNLNLNLIESDHLYFFAYNQYNINSSRKQILPLLKSILQSK